jgi:hypothetical protein
VNAAAAGPDEELGGIEGLLATVVVLVDGRELTAREILAAGIVSGRWQQFENELSEGLGLVAVERPAEAEVAEEVRAFRRARGLLSGEDLRTWVQERGLTIGAVKAVAARTVARRRGGTQRPVAAADVAEALPAEAICSGLLREVGFWLADRLLSAATTGASIEPIALERTRIKQLVFEEVSTVAGAVIAEAGLERAERLATMAALDDAHRAWEAHVTATREVARRLHEKELDWCRFELDELRLVSSGAAAEAARQLAEGGNPRQVAAAAGVPVTAQRVVLADAPSELARTLAGAVVGDVAGPWSDGGEHVVARVRHRHAPDVGDEQIVARAREELLGDAAARLRAGRVRWNVRT